MHSILYKSVNWVFLNRRGWSEAANTWEPVENLLQCSDIIDAFEERFYFL